MGCEQNTTMKCTCTYNCSRKNKCCECIANHQKNNEFPACFFSAAMEKTYDRSFEALVRDRK